MKYIILLGDGMADHPLDACQGRTPIEAAHTPNMDRVARMGVTGLFCPIPEGMPPGSDVGNLSLFGYDPRVSFSGRAAIEAASQGITLAANEVAFRCNLVTLSDGVMKDFTAGHITTEEASELIRHLDKELSASFPIRLHCGVSYRHTGVLKADSGCTVEDLAQAVCEPPHNITGQPFGPFLPKGTAADLLTALMQASQKALQGHPVNAARIAAGKLPAVSLWPWGQGRALTLESYRDRFGISGAVISAVDLVKGIGVCAGLEVLHVEGATGWIDTNYAGKVEAALNALEEHDFVYLHVEAPDEAAHQGSIPLKIQAIEDFDAKVVAPVLDYAAERKDCRVLVAPDHFTLISTKTHASGAVPFALCGPGIQPGESAAYGEGAALSSGIMIPDGHRLTVDFLKEETLSF